MGSVYLAERSDETFHRQVAIKLILPPAGSAQVIARFQQEREILASLDHPNIAKLLDAGVTDEGWPYFVMEFVEGRPIHRWCDERRLNISQRIELFRGVIDAVRYAHRHLVVHRDLKPGNIFVTNDGVVKLLDFGIAKVLSSTDAERAPDTVTLAGMMTPEYASPEQVKGAAITTLSDVYSLGVVLYELLTGHRPYRLLSAAMHEVTRVIAEVEPTRPSDVVGTSEPASGRDPLPITPENVSAAREGDPNRLRKRLYGDLDSILLMALRKEPERRYGSVQSFAEDLQRHLAQLTIQAREATPWERFLSFRLRSPGAFAAGVVVVIVFLSGLAAVAWQARHDIQAAARDSNIVPFTAPLWLFSVGLSIGALCAALYFSRAGKVQRIGAAAGGLVWGLGMTGRYWVERDQGWWHSRIAGHPDPLMLFSLLSWLTCSLIGAVLLLLLSMAGRRFGWKGQSLALVLLGFGQPFRERLWFGEFIPAVAFDASVVSTLASAGMLMAAGVIALLVMRAISGPEASSPAQTSQTPQWDPTPPAERYVHIDVLKGLALFGVLLVNVEHFYRIPLLETIVGQNPETGWADRWVDLFVTHALAFKAITIFSFLFGAGIAKQVERIANPRHFLARRFGWLFLLGVASLFLVSNGDILALYGICGTLLLPAIGLRWPALAVLGTVAMVLPEFVSIPVSIPTGAAAGAHIAMAREVYGNGGIVSNFHFRWQELWSLIVPLQIAILPRTVGLMCWGMAAWRSGILREPQRHRSKLLAALVFSVAADPLFVSVPVLLAVAYVSAFLLLQPGRASWMAGLAATGQMALTNYLLQSVILGFIFYGYGLGLFGRIGSVAGACIGLTLYLAQVQFSPIWLSRFRYGPFEWLWRSLAYGRRQVWLLRP